MHRSSPSRVVSSVFALVLCLAGALFLAAPVSATPDASTPDSGEPTVVSFVLDWWTTLLETFSPRTAPVGAQDDPSGDETSPVIDVNGPSPEDSSGDEVSPMIDPNGNPGGS